MTRHRTTHALLVVVAVLLGLNLTLLLSPPEAAGQEFDIRADAPHLRVIQVSPSGGGGCPIYRLWSDGIIERANLTDMTQDCVLGTNGSAWSVIPEGPVPLPPSVRVIQIFTECTNNQVIRELSDGSVQRNAFRNVGGETVWCGWQDVPEP